VLNRPIIGANESLYLMLIISANKGLYSANEVA
jgi:hypothetical protein